MFELTGFEDVVQEIRKCRIGGLIRCPCSVADKRCRWSEVVANVVVVLEWQKNFSWRREKLEARERFVKVKRLDDVRQDEWSVNDIIGV
jgi:hypothetical protein